MIATQEQKHYDVGMDKPLLTNIVHKVVTADGKSHCELCKTEIPQQKKKRQSDRITWNTGEYVAITNGLASQSMSVYRIGSHNKEPLCDGTPASEFFQESDGSHEREE